MDTIYTLIQLSPEALDEKLDELRRVRRQRDMHGLKTRDANAATQILQHVRDVEVWSGYSFSKRAVEALPLCTLPTRHTRAYCGMTSCRDA